MLHIGDFLDIVADILRRHVVQFIRRQIEISAEITVHIHLESPAHHDIAQIVFATCNRDFGIFNANVGRVVALSFSTEFVATSR